MERSRSTGKDAVLGLGLVLGVGLGLAACDHGDGRLDGAWLVVPDCRSAGVERRWEPFHRALGVMGANLEGDVLTLRFSPSGDVPSLSDQLVVVVEGYSEARATVARDGQLVRTISDANALVPGSPQVQAGLALLASCPRATASLVAAAGSATFTALGAKDGDRVSGRLTFDVIDRRGGAVAGASFVAEVDFDVSIALPQRSFSPHDL